MEPQTTQIGQQNLTPSQWPGAFGLYKTAKQATLVNWQASLLLILLSFAASFVLSMAGGNDTASAIYNIAQLVSLLIGVFLSVTATIIQLRNVASQKIRLGQALSESGERFFAMLGSMIISMFLLFGSFILFVIPFFFVLPRLALTPYYVVAQNLGPLAAIKASWSKTAGHSGKVWGLIGVAFLFSLLMITIIGIPFAAYLLFMYSSAYALLYSWIEKASSQTNSAQPTAPVAPTAPAAPTQIQ